MRSDGSLESCLSHGSASRRVPGRAMSLPLAMFVPIYVSASAPTPSGEMHTCKMKDCQAELVVNNHKYYCCSASGWAIPICLVFYIEVMHCCHPLKHPAGCLFTVFHVWRPSPRITWQRTTWCPEDLNSGGVYSRDQVLGGRGGTWPALEPSTSSNTEFIKLW